MILEGIVTTLNSTGVLNIAPMGPRIDSGFERFVLRPFRTSTTYENLKAQREGVLHVTDDVLLLAASAIGHPISPRTKPAQSVHGEVLLNACRYYEFKVTDLHDEGQRPIITVQTVYTSILRDFFGFNRAKHAVLETAIVATRVSFLPFAGLSEEIAKWRTIVEKTGGSEEAEAFALLFRHIQNVAAERGFDLIDAQQ